jgi:hypothetical protein
MVTYGQRDMQLKIHGATILHDRKLSLEVAAYGHRCCCRSSRLCIVTLFEGELCFESEIRDASIQIKGHI